MTPPESLLDPTVPKECDIVMKGGITSGVVYPELVASLAREYRFRNVGGTSAGAIAAAATAAAEYGRQGRNPGAFEDLVNLPSELASTVRNAKGSMLFNLFQPARQLRHHFGVVVSMLNAAKPATRVLMGLAGLVRYFWLWALLGASAGAIPAVALYVCLDLAGRSALMQVSTVSWYAAIAVVFAVLVAVLRFVFTARNALLVNDFGICSGMPGPTARSGGPQALSEWLFGYLQRLAGLPPAEVLTFGHLWANSDVAPDRSQSARNIDLQMMTTALNLGRPYVFPFHTRQFLFEPNELRRFFPEAVVEHLLQQAPASKDARAEVMFEQKRLFPLPPASQLPVVLGARLSLSFPVLLQAVPLYIVDYSLRKNIEGPVREATRVLFSDGGICSNFPIQFFDALLPMRPTFAIDLTKFPPEHQDPVRDRVWMPQPNRDVHHYVPPLGRDRSWTAFAAFFTSILDAARSWRDNLQQDAPAYRDRVVQVRQSKQEGGLNLDMPPPVITNLARAGSMAADQLKQRFLYLPPHGQPGAWAAHEFTRLRSLLGLLQPHLVELQHAFEVRYRDVVCQIPQPVYPFRSASQATNAEHMLAALAAVGAQQPGSGFDLSAGAPRPAPDIEIAPQP